jgi:hypothetical protein
MSNRHHAAALVLALLTTLAIFSGVSQLSSPTHAGVQLAQLQCSVARA